jgi:hypothetical protein
MNDTNKKTKKENPIENYNPTDRDFQRTEKDLDNVSKSEKDALSENAKKTNTKPAKKK